MQWALSPAERMKEMLPAVREIKRHKAKPHLGSGSANEQNAALRAWHLEIPQTLKNKFKRHF